MSKIIPGQINPALQELVGLAGKWEVELSNAAFLTDRLASVRSQALIEWVEDGALLVMRQGERDTGAPFATWTISRDEAEKEYTVLYYDDRKVSRVYQMSFTGRVWKIWRDAPGFRQRFEAKLSPDGKTLHAEWQKCTDGKTWEHDFDMTYRK